MISSLNGVCKSLNRDRSMQIPGNPENRIAINVSGSIPNSRPAFKFELTQTGTPRFSISTHTLILDISECFFRSLARRSSIAFYHGRIYSSHIVCNVSLVFSPAKCYAKSWTRIMLSSHSLYLPCSPYATILSSTSLTSSSETSLYISNAKVL